MILVELITVCLVGLLLFVAVSGGEFGDAIECYKCTDRAANTTCGTPRHTADLDKLDKIKCRRGACIKWTYYKNHELIMRRTCSEKINMRFQLDSSCHTERSGNGYLCMCPDTDCNSGHSQHGSVIVVVMALCITRLFLL